MRRALLTAAVPLVACGLTAATLWASGAEGIDASTSGVAAAIASPDPSAPPAPDPSDASPPPSPSPTVSWQGSAIVALSYLAWNPDSGAVEASGYAEVYEDMGVCALVLTKDGSTASAERAALPDVSTTACGGLAIDGSRLSSGTWDAVLHYESPTSAGSSAPREVVVP